MDESIRSASWYRVSGLTPQIRSHVHFHRHRYRGQIWYIVQDSISGRSHRISPVSYFIAGLMNGSRTVGSIWDSAYQQLGDDVPSQDEVIRLLSLLHHADLMRCDVPPDTVEILKRVQRHSESAKAWKRLANPLSIRLPLFDPDRLLTRLEPAVRPFFTVTAFVIGALFLLATGVVAVGHWAEIAAVAQVEFSNPRSLIILWFVYPVLKAFHEFGHAFAVKVWGGEVHEMGVIFLIFMPIPYVEASAASAFPEKWRRAAVGAAGIGVEAIMACCALWVLLAVEPGLVLSIAFITMSIGGISTLLFNGNPLLRFDGYYVLADLLETPNLAERSGQYITYLGQRYLLGLSKVRNPLAVESERGWLVAYGVLSFAYRVTVMFGISLLLASFHPLLGAAVAVMAGIQMVLLPAIKQTRFLLTAPWIAEQRLRAVSVAGLLMVGAVSLVCFVPTPAVSRSEGVVWPPEQALVRAGADGFAVRLLVRPGAEVGVGDPLVQTRQIDLETDLKILRSRLVELRAQENSERGRDLVRAQITREEISTVQAELALAKERAAGGVLRSPAKGTFVLPLGTDLIGHYLHEGEFVGYVIGDSVNTVRVAVSQDAVARIRDDTQRVQLRFVDAPGETVAGTLARETPAATRELPHPALGAVGGGRLAVDPEDPRGSRTIETIFELEISLPEDFEISEIGKRVHVRFDHSREPLGAQAARALSGLFLSRLGV